MNDNVMVSHKYNYDLIMLCHRLPITLPNIVYDIMDFFFTCDHLAISYILYVAVISRQ